MKTIITAIIISGIVAGAISIADFNKFDEVISLEKQYISVKSKTDEERSRALFHCIEAIKELRISCSNLQDIVILQQDTIHVLTYNQQILKSDMDKKQIRFE